MTNNFVEKLNDYEKDIYQRMNCKNILEDSIQKKLVSPLNDLIKFNPFQYEPYYNITKQKQYPKVVYIADEVGSGKTIETGIILTELLFQNEIRLMQDLCLIVCPNLLCRKWRDTLKLLFGLDASIVYSINDVNLGINILSYDTISNSSEQLEIKPTVLIIDEVHNASGKRYEKIKKIRDNVNSEKGYVILLSATPLSGIGNDEQKQKDLLKQNIDIDDFFNSKLSKDYHYLCKNEKKSMRYATNPSKYKVNVKVLNHFIENQALMIFNKCCKELFAGKNTLLQFQGLNMLISSPAAGVLYIERLTNKTDDELLEYLISSNEELDMDDESEDDYTYEEEIKNYSLEDVARIRNELGTVKSLLERVICEKEPDKKFEKLLEIIESNKKNSEDIENLEHDFYKHIIVFTDRVSTARYLEEKLKKQKKIPCEVFRVTGEMFESEKRNKLMQYESEKEKVSVLIITNVACEGQDMDYGNTIINYDLDYNPVRLEQRRGRIDRFEVKKDTIFIHNIMVTEFDFDPGQPEKKYDKFSKVKKIWDKIQNIEETTGTYYDILLDSKVDEEQEEEVLNSTKKMVFDHVIELVEVDRQYDFENSSQVQEKIMPYCIKQFGEYDSVYSLISDRIKNLGIRIEEKDGNQLNVITTNYNQDFLRYVYHGGTLISHLIMGEK